MDSVSGAKRKAKVADGASTGAALQPRVKEVARQHLGYGQDLTRIPPTPAGIASHGIGTEKAEQRTRE
jgi:hypothetical protein